MVTAEVGADLWLSRKATGQTLRLWLEGSAWLGQHWQLLVLPAPVKKVLSGSFSCFEVGS